MGRKMTKVKDEVYINEDGEAYNPWELPELVVKEKTWQELSCGGKVKRVGWEWIGRPVLLIGLLYMFICSLDLLSSAFKMLGGKAAGQALSSHAILQNPVAGLMIGVLVTVLVQSSSTSTSIIVAMVGAEVLPAKLAVPLIFGANIGTTVTNTIVSMGQSGRKDEFRRAFGAATVHDMFNWLNVFIWLPIEAIWHPLFLMTEKMIDTLNFDKKKGYKGKLLKALTEPFTKKIVQIDKKAIEKIAKGGNHTGDYRILKNWCGQKVMEVENATINATAVTNKIRCESLFAYFDISDEAAGGILLAVSLIMLCFCLYGIVKILHSIFRGKMAVVVKKVINAEFPGKAAFLTGYVAILIGAGCTFLVQSSSIFTSVLTPLAGIGVVTLDRMYPLTLGSNIGTTTTSLLAALVAEKNFHLTLQIALVHLFFNIFGICIWYPIPFMRAVPINLAKSLGNTTAEFRWFALIYLILMFFLLPGGVMALSFAGWPVLLGVGGPFLLLFIVVCFINILQGKIPERMGCLRDWSFLPLCLRSLEPYDRVLRKAFGWCGCCKNLVSKGGADEEKTVMRSEEPTYLSSRDSMAQMATIEDDRIADKEADAANNWADDGVNSGVVIGVNGLPASKYGGLPAVVYDTPHAHDNNKLNTSGGFDNIAFSTRL